MTKQGEKNGVYIPGVNPTMMLNYYRATRPAAQAAKQNKAATTRGLILARFRGYGNHRYQVGFSGDVVHSWKSFAFQVRPSLTINHWKISIMCIV